MHRMLMVVLLVGCGTTAPPPAEAPPTPREPGAKEEDAPKTHYSPGLGVVDVKVGGGDACKAGDKITVRYVGTLDDGSEFDSNKSATFWIGKGMLIQGWDEGIPGMRVGGIRNLTIPPSLGYGSTAKGKIPAYSTLHFEVELLAIEP
jgi:FKBP-type peptidyl-prolyl cis-trans isomerase FkpA